MAQDRKKQVSGEIPFHFMQEMGCFITFQSQMQFREFSGFKGYLTVCHRLSYFCDPLFHCQYDPFIQYRSFIHRLSILQM